MAMKAVGVMQVAPAGWGATAERLARAWDHASALVRRVTLLAATTSLVVGASVPAGPATKVATGAVGVSFVLAAMVDVHERRLPNRLLAIAAMFAGLPLADQPSLAGFGRLLGGAMLGGGLLLAVRLARGIGMGDVKMAAVVGASVASVSLFAVPVAVAAAAAAGAFAGLAMRRTALPFGPALWLGWAAALTATSMGWWT